MPTSIKAVACALAVTLLCTLAALLGGEPPVAPADADEGYQKTVIIDPGHGGFDGGAVVGGVVEKDLNLVIGLKVAGLLRLSGFRVVMTRTDDSSTESDPDGSISVRKASDLKNRLALAGGYPDGILVSIHLNKYPQSDAVHGAQVFYSPRADGSKALAEDIDRKIKALIQRENRRPIKAAPDGNYLLGNAAIPAVIVECGFMSNRKELDLLCDDKYQSKIALAIFCGICEYF